MPTSASKPASAGQSWDGINDTMATRSTALKCTTVGLMKAFIAARSFSVKTLVPIEAATNMRPTKVAAAVPMSRSKSCQASRSSVSEDCMVITARGAMRRKWSCAYRGA